MTYALLIAGILVDTVFEFLLTVRRRVKRALFGISRN